jgi:hypothetical protein
MPQQTYTTTGRIHALPEAEQRGNFTIRKCVLEVEGYKDKELPVFEFFGKNADKLNGLRVGAEAEITWQLKGRENNAKFYTTLSAFKIESTSAPESRRAPDRGFERPERQQEKSRTVPGYNDRDSVDIDPNDEIPF